MNRGLDQSHRQIETRLGALSYMLMIGSLMVGLIIGLGGCGDPVPEEIDLTQGYHMLGIRVDPPIARPDDVLTITAYDHHPTLKDLAYDWSLCLYSHGAGSNYECLSKEALLPLGGEVPRVRVDLSKGGIDLRTRLRLAQDLDVYGERRALVEGLDLFIILNSGDPSEGLTRTVKRVRVIDRNGDEPLGENPKIEGWRIEERGVANLRDPCVMIAPGAGSALEFDSSGAVLAGRERLSVIEEVSGKPVNPSEDLNQPACVMHADATLDVFLNVEGKFAQNWDTEESYTYRWYVTGGHSPVEPVTLGGEGYGRYQLLAKRYRAELIFTVQDPDGGFSVGRQKLHLVPGISTR